MCGSATKSAFLRLWAALPRKNALLRPLPKRLAVLSLGADSVYAAGQLFGLRAFAGNLSDQDMQVLLQTAQEKGKKIYITVNILAHNNDIELMPAYLEKLASLPVDGLIVSDLGVISLASKYARDLPITVSTQASVTNYAAAAQYKELGSLDRKSVV